MVFINGYTIDVAKVETHTFESEVTSYPVETGADVVDHVRSKPIMVTLECIVSDTPFGDLADFRTAEQLSGIADALPSLDAYQRLLEMRDARQPVIIETSLATYDNMALQSLSIPRSAETGDALQFTATFQQVEIVETERKVVRVAVPRAKAKQNLGNKPAEPVENTDKKPAPKTEVDRSILKNLKDALF